MVSYKILSLGSMISSLTSNKEDKTRHGERDREIEKQHGQASHRDF